MIHLRINPVRVEQVVVEADSDLEEDFDLAAWRLVRPVVRRLNQVLGRTAAQAVGKTGPFPKYRQGRHPRAKGSGR